MLERMYCTKLVKRITVRQEACGYFQMSGYPKMNNPFYRGLRKAMCRKYLKEISEAFREAPSGSILSLSYMETHLEMFDNTSFAFEVMNRILTINGYRSKLHLDTGTFRVIYTLYIYK